MSHPTSGPTAADAIAYALATTQKLLHRYTADLSPEDYLHRPAPKANCAAWLLGHLILSERRALAHLGVTDLPALPGGFEKRFGRDESAAQACEFGDVTTLRSLFDEHRRRMIDAVRAASPEQLARPLEKPHPMFGTTAEMIHFIAIHATMHAGQITIIRRSLGRPPLI